MPRKLRRKPKSERNNAFLPNVVQFPEGGNGFWFDRSVRIFGKQRLKPIRFNELNILDGPSSCGNLSSSESSGSTSKYDSHNESVSSSNQEVEMPYSGSSALDRCYIGGKGFSRFLKHQAHSPGHEEAWSDSATDTSYFRTSFIATTTQGAPYSSSDLVGSYNNESKLTSTEDLRHTNGNITERTAERSRAKLSRDTGEPRPNSKKNLPKTTNVKVASSTVDKESRLEKPDNRYKNNQYQNTNEKEVKSAEAKTIELREIEGGRESAGLLPPANNNAKVHTNYSNFRPLNSRNNFLGGQQINPLPSQQRCSTQQSGSSHSHSRESEELVAMGTNPIQPGGGGTRGGNFGGRQGSFNNGVYYSQSSSGALGSLRKFNNKPNVFTRGGKDSEPRYGDPFVNSPPTFNQRIAEIQSLEQETIRYERTKKFRKKKSETT